MLQRKHLLMAGVALAVCSSVFAQDEDPAPAPEVPQDLETIPVQGPAEIAPEPAADAPTQLDEVVVTAQKTQQPLSKVPISVSTFDGKFIRDTGSVDLAEVSLYVPNVRIDADDPGSPQIFIRGFGTNTFNPSFESSVALVQDELYFGRPGYFTESMFDIDRIEVLRGPQGTLFGKNTVAGVFNIITRGPEGDWQADGRYFYGEDNEQRIEAGAGGVLGDWAAVRVAGMHRTQDGELRNQFLDRFEEAITQDAGRVKLRLSLPFGLETELLGATSEMDAPFWPYQLFRLDEDTRTYLEGFDPDIEDDPYDFVTSFETPGFITKGSDTGAAKVTWDLGELGPLHDFSSVLVVGTSSFHMQQLNELDVSPANLLRLGFFEDQDQVSGEWRFSGNADSLFGFGTGLEFVTGVFYYDTGYAMQAQIITGEDFGSFAQTCDFQQLASGDMGACGGGPSPPGNPVFGPITAPITDGDYYQLNFDQDITSTAVFGQLTWNITEHWAITPGLRYNTEEKRANARGESHCQGRELGQPCANEQLLESQDYDQRGLARDETDVSPKLAVQYLTGGGLNYYVSYARGYKSGGFNSISLTGGSLEYEPEKARTYEAGVKGKFFERTLGVNATVYQMRFENLQVLAFNGVFFDVSNAATAESQGLEVDFQWLTPFEPLRVMGSAGLLEAKYISYPEAPAPISQGINQLQDLSGERIAFAPKATATLTPVLTYFFGGMVASLAVDALYQGDQYTDTDLDPNTHVDACIKYAARLTFASAAETWGVSIGGANLTDERVLNQVTDSPLFPGTYFAQQASGRQLFATASFNF